MPADEYRTVAALEEEWLCTNCREPISNENDATANICWGDMKGMESIKIKIQETFDEITTWQKNTFEVPRGNAGRDFISEMARLIQLFNNKTRWEPVAIHCLQIFMPLMLQKPSKKSKNKDHIRYLVKRIKLWKEGKLSALISEGKEIQKRLQSSSRKEEEMIKGFSRLMLLGKVRQALKLVDTENDIAGIHKLTEEIRGTLEGKHPNAEPARETALSMEDASPVEEVIFEEIDVQKVQRASKNTSGSGGPTKIDADTWKHILCSKAFTTHSENLANEIAVFARRMCTENIPNEHISSLLSCRLVPLMKEDNGVRPVGVGETLRRIIGKCITQTLSHDIQIAGGTLQTCTGVEAGIEAAIHAVQKFFNEEGCEAVLLVDADNAFNRLNRKVALHNIQRTCPPLFKYLNNSYNKPAKLYLADGSFLLSEEGVTQGDNLAMAMYALSTKPLIECLTYARGMVEERFKQVWFADDSTGVGELEKIKMWWENLKAEGPAFGYFPKPSKTHLIVKNRADLERAQELFEGDGVNITLDGERHIGAVIGSDEFRVKYINTKVEKWIKDIEKLAEIAKEEPQVALSAYNTGLSQRWKFVQRTVRNTGQLFEPLEEAIRTKLIPAICGKNVSPIERRMIALPYRFGGLGIQNPTQTANREYLASCRITAGLTNLIYDQDMDITKLDKEAIKKEKKELRKEKDEMLKEEVEVILQQLDDSKKRSLITAQKKGALSWLAALPVKRLGYVLNKQEFRDALCLRYGWRVNETPAFCACGTRNDIDHILTCKKGGYVSMRHNALRDMEAKIMEEVCKDVKTEPLLIPIERDIQGNSAQQARLDISARGVWSSNEKTFFDVRVTHPNAVSHRSKSLQQLYKQNENEKKRLYSDRVINCERATFTPLVFTTTGGMGPECDRLNRRLAELIAVKRREAYSDVIGHIRTRLRFALLRSTLVALRGVRGKCSGEPSDMNISFNLIPQEGCYETR